MTYAQILTNVSQFLNNNPKLVVQYAHFIQGVFIIQSKDKSKFSFIFLKWLDENEIYHVGLQNPKDDIYLILVEKET